VFQLDFYRAIPTSLGRKKFYLSDALRDYDKNRILNTDQSKMQTKRSRNVTVTCCPALKIFLFACIESLKIVRRYMSEIAQS